MAKINLLDALEAALTKTKEYIDNNHYNESEINALLQSELIAPPSLPFEARFALNWQPEMLIESHGAYIAPPQYVATLLVKFELIIFKFPEDTYTAPP